MTLPVSQPSYFDSNETGAPTLNNVVSSALEVMRACLVNGFGAKTVTSIDVASGVATATAASHGYTATYGKLILIEGAPEALLNGRHQPLSVTTNTFTFDVAGVADGNYTGTISAKRAPLGWTEPYTGTNKAIFARSAVDALAQMLRVLDDGAVASIVRVRGVVSASDVDTTTGDFPSAAQISGGAYWQKGANSATAKRWFIAGDSRAFFFGTQLGSSDSFVVYFFGDGVPYYVGDAGFTLLSGQTSTGYTTTPAWSLATGTSQVGSPGSGNAIYAASGVLPGEAGSQYQSVVNPSGSVNISGYSSFQSAVNYPNPVIHPLLHVLSQGPCIRGQWPGLAYVFANAPFTNLQVVDAGTDKFLAVSVGASGANGQMAIKLSGGWY